jgi:hypothetical protein
MLLYITNVVCEYSEKSSFTKKELQINKMLQNDANFAITNGKKREK